MWLTAHDLLTGLGMILGYEIARRFYVARRRRRARRAAGHAGGDRPGFPPGTDVLS